MEPGTNIAARPQTAMDEEAARAARQMSRRRAVVGMLLVAALAALVRLPLLSFPMGPTAGTLGYVGRRWVSGAVPYRDAWDSAMPGSYLVAGVVLRGLGTSVFACRLAMFAFGLGTLLGVYALVRQWCHRTEAVAAAGICGFFSGPILVQGDCLNPESPMILFLVLAFLAALRSQGRLGWLALSGLAGGLAVCFRLAAALYLAALVLWAALANRAGVSGPRRGLLRPMAVLVGAALPAAGFVAYFASRGALAEFWRSAVLYNYLYNWPLAGGVRWARSAREVVSMLAPEQGALWLFAGGWAVYAFSMGFRRETGLVALWGAVAVVAALLARQVEAERFLETVPPLAIGAALAVTNPSERLLKRDERGRLEGRSILLILFAVALAAGFLHTEWRAYREHTARDDTDRAAAEVARIIRARTRSGDPIYVWGTRPQVYVLADRPAAHRFFYNRPLNSRKLVDEFFGPEVFADIYETLVRVQPCFVVTTEDYLPEPQRIDRLGPIAPLFYYLRDNYDQSWGIVDAKPYSFTIFARRDRALLP